MDESATARTPRWTHEPLEESLDGARMLTVSVVDLLMRDAWEQLAVVTGVPSRRWRRHHPIGDASIVALIDGEPAFDDAAWSRFVSLVPGAVALPSRTAAAFGVGPAELAPPGRPPWRLMDLVRARRVRARLRRTERRLAADLEVAHVRRRAHCLAALAPGEDGTPLERLPTYALAARLERILDAGRNWREAAMVEVANGDATARLMRLLQNAGARPGDALLQLARATASGHPQQPDHLIQLEQIARLAGGERDAELQGWLDGLCGWHAMRELLLEARPLRDDSAAVIAWMDRITEAPTRSPTAWMPGPEVATAVERARRLASLRTRAAHTRADLHAAVRAVTHALANRLAADGVLPCADAAFDLHVHDLIRAARGVAVAVAVEAPADGSDVPDAAPPDVAAGAREPELRGIPASAGTSSGPVLVLDAPAFDAPVDGVVLVCRNTDPAWLPLMLRCAGLVTERGGPLSHAAIVARELGLPAVVGAAGATSVAHGAASAEVDGDSGIVRFIRP